MLPTREKPPIIPDASTIEQAAVQAADRDIKAGVQFGTAMLWRILKTGKASAPLTIVAQCDPPPAFYLVRMQADANAPILITLESGETLNYLVSANGLPLEINLPGLNNHSVTVAVAGVATNVYYNIIAASGMDAAQVGMLL